MRAFGESGQWAELTALAKTKKSPIGFAPFLDVCLKQVRLMNSYPTNPILFSRVKELRLLNTSHSWGKRTDLGLCCNFCNIN